MRATIVSLALLVFGVLALDGCGGNGDGSGSGDEVDMAPASTDLESNKQPDLAKSSDGCPHGYTRCEYGCVALGDDAFNCGACGNVCGLMPHVLGSAYCQAGSCHVQKDSCQFQYGDCNGDLSDGCETLLTSPSHCGACDTTCGVGAPLCTSSSGAYSCATGCSWETPTLCGGACVDTINDDVANCGGCDQACTAPAHGSVACHSETCEVTCDAGYVGCATGCCTAWPMTPLDPVIGGGTIGDARFTVDANQLEHVVFISQKVQELVYAKSDGASFTLERIDQASGYYALQSFAMRRATDGTIHVAYSLREVNVPYGTTAKSELRYARRTNSGWTHETIAGPATKDLGLPQLAFGASGAVHLLYSSGGMIFRTRNADGTYTAEEKLADEIGADAALTSTSTGKAALAYSTSGHVIKFGTRESTGWSFEPIKGQTGSVESVSLDPSDRPYVVSRSNTSNARVESHKLVGFWETLNYDATSRIFFDGSGVPYSIKITATSTPGKYAVAVQKFTTSWGVVSSFDSTYAGLFGVELDGNFAAHLLATSTHDSVDVKTISAGKVLPVDALRKPGVNVKLATIGSTTHFVYSDELGGTFHATRAGATWKQQAWPVSERDPQIVVNGGILYGCAAAATGDLYFLKLTGDTWSSEKIANTAGAAHCSIAFDGNGKPHIAYSTATPSCCGGLTTYHTSYVKKTGASWEKFDVEIANATSFEVLVAIDPTGAPQVAFTSGGVLKLGRWDGTRFVQQSLATGSLYPAWSFVYDAAGTGHMLLSGGVGGIAYASLVGATFTSEPLMNDTYRNGGGHLILGASGPIVVYMNYRDDSLASDRYLTIARRVGTTWTQDNVIAPEHSIGAPDATLQGGKLLVGIYDKVLSRLLLATEP